jgi:hypothetical protein
MKTKAWLGLLAVSSIMAIGGVITACGEEETTIAPPSGNDGGGSSLDDSGGVGNADAPTTDPDAGEPITDGGSNIDLDASLDDDAGDAAPCNALANGAPAVASACISNIPVLPGGALVAGSYHLTNVLALGNPAFCQTQFRPAMFQETMDLAVDANGVGTANIVLKIATQPQRTRTITLDPPANNASPLLATQTCPPRGGDNGNVRYFSGLRNNEQVLILLLQYGNGGALYRFVKQ